MKPALLQRQAALAGVALLATLGALALTTARPRNSLAPSVSGEVKWQRAVVGVLPLRSYSHKTRCGVELDSGTLGVAHPLLPCGVDLVVSVGSKEIRTEVVERKRVEAGRDFDLTQGLAAALGVHGTQRIRWRFAG